MAVASQAEPGLLVNAAGGDDDADGARAGDTEELAAVMRRMKEVVRVLENFAALREPGRSRVEYMDQVRHLAVLLSGM